MAHFNTLADVIKHLEAHRNPRAFNYLQNGVWLSLSSEGFLFDLKRLTYGLIHLGIRRGDSAGILSDPSPFWILADFAIILAGGLSVPLFAKISHESFVYECAQANVRYLFVQGEDHWKMYEEHRNLFDRAAIALDSPPKNLPGVISLHQLLQEGEKLWAQKPELWEELIQRCKPEDICTIIYSAGSAGMPKGIQLTHRNLCHLMNFETFSWSDEDIYLNILPLAHVFARQINMILMAWGVSIYYLNDLSRLVPTCQEIKPSIMIVVPRVLEKIYIAIEAKIKSLPKTFKNFLVKKIFYLASDTSDSLFKKYLLWPLGKALLYRKIGQGFGGRFRIVLCGGAALDKGLNQFFCTIGVPVYEGWGLTEASTICVNTPKSSKIGTVGKPLPEVKIKFGDDEELLLSGPTIMSGYYRNPEATAIAIDSEGWLHTGDKGKIDSEGFVRITGRVKEQFKLSTGEYVSPTRIEYVLTQHPLIDMALVVGEKHKYVACFLFPDKNEIQRQKKEQQIESLSDEAFLQSTYVKDEIEQLLKKVNQRINSWEKVSQYRFILKTPTVENGQLTPTLKLKRDLIIRENQELLKTMYEEN